MLSTLLRSVPDHGRSVQNMKCPNCQHKFNYYNVFMITQWSSITCPDCHSKWTRKTDLHSSLFFILLLLSMFALLTTITIIISMESELLLSFKAMIQSPKIQLAILIGIIWLLLIAIADAATIKLSPATKRTGWKRILGDKTELSDRPNR